MRLRKPCTMRVRGHNNVGRAVRTDPTLLSYFSAITSKEMLGVVGSKVLPVSNFAQRLPCNNTQQHATGCANGRNV